MKRDMNDMPVEDIPDASLINPTLFPQKQTVRPIAHRDVIMCVAQLILNHFHKIGTERHAVEVHPKAVLF
jgi:hypothetical protein